MLRTILFLLLSLLSLQLYSQDAKRILGTWINMDSTQIIQIEKRGDKFVGQLIGLSVESSELLLDSENDDLEKRNRKLLGLDVWLNFVYDEEKDMWKDGQIYNFKNGNTYNGKIQVVEDQLTLTGHYGLFFFLSKNQNWIRIK